jgi:hypothetical protein
MISQADNKPVDPDMPQKLASKPSKFEKVDSQYSAFLRKHVSSGLTKSRDFLKIKKKR